ncbi:MAG: hypothetical protein ABI699_20060 [Caldimonas sp.]
MAAHERPANREKCGQQHQQPVQNVFMGRAGNTEVPTVTGSSPNFARTSVVRMRTVRRMEHKVSACIGSLVLVVACDLASAQLVPVAWDAAGRFAHKASLAPGKFVEICEKLPRGTKVDWSFRSSAPLNFNIHYHEGKEVAFATRQDASAGAEGRLDTSSDQDYCWMWTNKYNKATTLDLALKRE